MTLLNRWRSSRSSYGSSDGSTDSLSTSGISKQAASRSLRINNRRLNKPLAGYAKVNLHTSYDINDHVQVYGLIDNLFDKKFGTFGNYFNIDSGNTAAQGAITFTDPRTVVPGAPQAFYAGLRIKF